jgi:hypothetical protein
MPCFTLSHIKPLRAAQARRGTLTPPFRSSSKSAVVGNRTGPGNRSWQAALQPEPGAGCGSAPWPWAASRARGSGTAARSQPLRWALEAAAADLAAGAGKPTVRHTPSLGGSAGWDGMGWKGRPGRARRRGQGRHPRVRPVTQLGRSRGPPHRSCGPGAGRGGAARSYLRGGAEEPLLWTAHAVLLCARLPSAPPGLHGRTCVPKPEPYSPPVAASMNCVSPKPFAAARQRAGSHSTEGRGTPTHEHEFSGQRRWWRAASRAGRGVFRLWSRPIAAAFLSRQPQHPNPHPSAPTCSCSSVGP